MSIRKRSGRALCMSHAIPFYLTQGGYECRMTYRIDFEVIRGASSTPASG